MRDGLPDGLKIISLTKENDGLRSTIEELRKKNRRDKGKLIALCFVLLVATLILGTCYHATEEGYKYAREEVLSLESEMEVLQRKYTKLEQSAQNVDELEAENASLARQVEEQESEISWLEANLAAYSSGDSSSVTSSTSDTQSVTVYITNTGSKYHKNGCQYLRESKNAVTLSQAKSWGYTACSRCY